MFKDSQAFISPSIRAKVINTCTVSPAALVVCRIKINRATFVRGTVVENYFPFKAAYSICFFNFRQLLLCRVTLGKMFMQLMAMKMAHAPPGHHSVVGKPSPGGLSYPEYVIYRGEQVKTKIHSIFTSLLFRFMYF